MAAPSPPTTPPATMTLPMMSTPIVHSSSTISHVSSQRQEDLKDKMKMEYSGQVFASNQLFSKIFQSTVPNDKIKRAIDDCIESFKKLPPLAEKEAQERDHYPPFVARLNAVKQSLMRHGCMKDSIYSDVEFEVYDKSMAGGVGSDAALQPDALARVTSATPTPNDKAYWEDVELCVEVKDKYGEMVAQGATYARSMSYAQRGRRFVLMIFFEQTKAQASFGLFTPAWLCLSKTRYNLRAERGKRNFITDMARIWSCTDRWSAGFEDTCNNVHCFLKGFGTFSYRENICFRNSLRGRRTRVDFIHDGMSWTESLPLQNEYILRQIKGRNEYTPGKQKSKQSQGSGSLDRKMKSSSTSSKHLLVGDSSQSGNRASPRLAAKRLEEQRLRVSKNRPQNSPSKLTIQDQPPLRRNKTFILKDSWPIVSRATREADVFGIAGNNGGMGDNADEDDNEDEKNAEFGISVILDCFTVTNSKGEISDTASPFPQDAELFSGMWDENESKQESNEQNAEPNETEQRVHVRLLISTQGLSLEDAKGPKELVQAVLHAMIGYSVIFRRRWLHRDVSIGNVLLMKTAKKRKPIKGFEDILTEDILAKHFEKCVGFISDGDLAVNWDKPDRVRGKQRSGTPPFMSCELLETMNEEAFQSAIDDLESFVWVLFWAILSILRRRHAITTHHEDDYWVHLTSLDISVLRGKSGFSRKLFRQYVALRKQKIRKKGDPPLQADLPSPGFAPFVALLREWLELALSEEAISIRIDLPTTPVDEHERIVQEWIGKYLSIGIKHLDTFPDTWDYLP